MRMMECRRLQLNASLEGLQATDTPLIEMHGNTFSVAGFPDDPGIYYFIPWIAKVTGLSIDSTINLFFGLLLGVGALVSIVCLFCMFKHWSIRSISIIGISLLTLVSFHYSDVYIASFFAVTSIIPIFLLLHHKSYSFHWKFLPILFFSGVVIGYSNFIRSHSGTGTYLFLIAWIALNKQFLVKEKISFLLFLSIFVSIPYIHFNSLEKNRDHFLLETNPEYKSRSISHPLWHPIYLGLSYLDNPYGIEWEDAIGFKTAVSIDPEVQLYSEKYELLLKNRFFAILRENPIFVLKTLLFKLFSILLRIAMFVNFGFLFLAYIGVSFRFVSPFIFSACFYSLPGILVLPVNNYLIGLASISTLFGLIMIGLGIEKYLASKSCLERHFQIR